MSLEPLAFMSYARKDDEHDNNRISEFCKLLMAEIQTQTGKHFHIFQDTKDIKPGEQWQRRLDKEIDNSTFLIPIITPRFFESEACTSEVKRFTRHEQQLGRDDLIIPIYYLKADAIEDSNSSNEIAKLLKQRQFINWRDKRFLEFDKPSARADIAVLAEKIVERTKRLEQSKVLKKASQPEPVQKVEYLPAEKHREPKPQAVSNQKAPKQYVVDAYHQGDFVTISEAIETAEPGSTILIQEGFYQESLIIEKPLKIIGLGNREEIVIESDEISTIRFKANVGLLQNLTICNKHNKADEDCISIQSGRLEINSCDILSQYNTIYAIGKSLPKITNSSITCSKQEALYFGGQSSGLIENNDIQSDNDWAISLYDQTNPTISNNKITSLTGNAIFVDELVKGHIKNNRIYSKYEPICLHSNVTTTIGENQFEKIK